MKFDKNKLEWINKPKQYTVEDGKIEIMTEPGTDLWQRTYYHFRNDNAPMLQMETEDSTFSFTVKASFASKNNFDQAGIVMYLDSENWLKASVEYGDEKKAFLGAVVTNNGYSDWSTTQISATINTMWFRLSRRGEDFCVETSSNGNNYEQIRICHVGKATQAIRFGVYACSPEDGTFKAQFTEFEVGECKWALHQGQQPDEDLKPKS